MQHNVNKIYCIWRGKKNEANYAKIVQISNAHIFVSFNLYARSRLASNDTCVCVCVATWIELENQRPALFRNRWWGRYACYKLIMKLNSTPSKFLRINCNRICCNHFSFIPCAESVGHDYNNFAARTHTYTHAHAAPSTDSFFIFENNFTIHNSWRTRLTLVGVFA